MDTSIRRVVVTGMGVISPVGNDVETFWNSLLAGKCGIDFITRFDTEGYKVKIAAEVKNFDILSYMDKSDARRADIYTHYAVAAASQAMADSGLAGGVDPYRFGVYIGSATGGMETLITECTRHNSSASKKTSPFFVPMMISNMASGTVAIKFGAKGPCLPVVTACATATHSIGEAFRAIKHGYADAILTGGAEATINSLCVSGFTSCMALATTNDPLASSLPFDKRRDGFVMGEGAGVLVLEEYGHAVKRGAKIYAELAGYGNTCDAYHITAPQPEGEGGAAAISCALTEAGISEYSGLYINAHGTGTVLNDKVETVAIKRALGDAAYKVPVSSTKSMTGHMLGAAGAAEAIASILAIINGIIPPTIGLTEKDPECDLDYVPLTARHAELSAALSTSLGFGGHNACIAIKKVQEGR